MKRLLPLLLMPFFLFSYEKGLDVSLSLDPLSVEKGSRVDISHQLFFPFESRLVILNPRMCAYFDNHVDLSFGVGQRHVVKGSLLGYHLFYDFSKHSPMYFHQGAVALEYLTSQFDYRFNYYHPLVDDMSLEKFSYHPHKWMEAEAMWKGDRFSVAVGPVFNVSTQSFSAKARVMIPYKNAVLSAGVECDRSFDLRSFVSLGYQLYNLPKTSEKVGVGRNNRVRFEQHEIPLSLPPPAEEKGEVAVIEINIECPKNPDIYFVEINVEEKDLAAFEEEFRKQHPEDTIYGPGFASQENTSFEGSDEGRSDSLPTESPTSWYSWFVGEKK